MQKFKNKVYLSSPTMHGEELNYIKQAYDSNWVSTAGQNISVIEQTIGDMLNHQNSVALSSGTSALHLAIKLAGIKEGDNVFCSDLTFVASANPILYEKANPIFIDSEYDTWNMDPEALEKAFSLYPNTKLVIVVNLYGTPAKLYEICEIANRHGAIVVEDAAESLGAVYKGKQTGSFGRFNVISFNGNKIITGSSGGMLLSDDLSLVNKAKKLSTQSRENTTWYQHNEIGYNYRMSNIVAGIVRGQLPYLEQHIKRKKEIYTRYKNGFKNIPVTMNPYLENCSEPNFWLSCILINKDALCKQVITETGYKYEKEKGKTCPSEILDILSNYNAEGRHMWKPMRMQPLFKNCPFVTKDGLFKEGITSDVGSDIFNRGLCLPSDIKMTNEEQDNIIQIVCSCFEKGDK